MYDEKENKTEKDQKQKQPYFNNKNEPKQIKAV